MPQSYVMLPPNFPPKFPPPFPAKIPAKFPRTFPSKLPLKKAAVAAVAEAPRLLVPHPLAPHPPAPHPLALVLPAFPIHVRVPYVATVCRSMQDAHAAVQTQTSGAPTLARQATFAPIQKIIPAQALLDWLLASSPHYSCYVVESTEDIE